MFNRIAHFVQVHHVLRFEMFDRLVTLAVAFDLILRAGDILQPLAGIMTLIK